MAHRLTPPCAVIVDVDGVVSPVHPVGDRTMWGNEVTAGRVFGPDLVSPALCERLDAIADRPGVQCGWLTSWSEEMRAAMQPFPGRHWPTTADQESVSSGQRWWKLVALEAWLEGHPEIASVCWLDDHLRNPARAASVRRRLALRGVDALLVAPSTQVGLRLEDLARVEESLP